MTSAESQLLPSQNQIHKEADSNVNSKGQKNSSWFCCLKQKKNKLPYLEKKINLRHHQRSDERYVHVHSKNTMYNGPQTKKLKKNREPSQNSTNKFPSSSKICSLQQRKQNYYEDTSNRSYVPTRGLAASENNLIGQKLANEKYIAQKPNLIPQQYDIKLSYVSQPSGQTQLAKPSSQRIVSP